MPVTAIEQRNAVDAAIAVFDSAWQGAPDRALLVDCNSWRVVAANPASRDDMLDAHNIDVIGLELPPLVADSHNLEESRLRWRDKRDADITVRPHAFDPDRFVRLSIWPLGGFDGTFLIVVSRDLDTGFRSSDAFQKAQPLLDVSNNLVALASGRALLYTNPRFSQQFQRLSTVDELINGFVHAEDRALCRSSVAMASDGEPGRPIDVRIAHSSGEYAGVEWAVAPAPTLAEDGVLIVLVPLGVVDVVHLPDSFTPRERDIVRLLLQGLRVPSIATALYLSQHTVRNHLRTIFAKCDVNSQRALIEQLRSSAG
jgi:DNA-binding CsgD family transcriptional regulator